jgi:hypothetical protein
MKRFLVLIGLVVAAGALVWIPGATHAQSAPMTEAHIQRIKANCVDAQSILTQLHASDALLRVNRGQLYESISSKLMAPFNSRVALNKFDGSKLVAQSATYETQLNEFRSYYKSYEEAMSKTLRINCVNEPVAFYDSVADARTKRQQVHQKIVALQSIIQAYKAEFERFAQQLEEERR